jgi:hypothetical protein
MANQFLVGTIQIPSALTITAISQANPMVITATVPKNASNTYIVGQAIRLNIPYNYGMYQANGLTLTITAISGLNFTVNVNSSGFDPFVVPGTGAEQPATFAPSGSRNLQYTNNTALSVPFQSLNNQGN